MNLVKWHPVNDAFNNLLQKSFEAKGFPRHQSSLELALDIYETEDELVLTASLPGATRDDFSIEYEDKILTVQGTVKATPLPDGAKSLLAERSAGTVTRTLRIPQLLNIEQSSATFQDGVLQVHLPKSAEARKKSIQIS